MLGTAGHIDHGKTSLVRALTGHETDRLPEEQKRGITIELGFAAWKINRDFEASIIDMPGHESFVRTMVAGAGGLDCVMFVISAEDGVMPQTREHLEICKLLGLTRGVVALTKVDLLDGDEDSIELAAEDVREALADSPFAECEIIPCSAVTGQGIEELKRTLVQLLKTLPQLNRKGAAVLPVDRAFSLKGHGTIVTGTLMEGELKLPRDESLRHIPIGEGREEREVRVRGMQVRGKEADRSVAGTRTSINLGGAAVDEFHRGDVLTHGPRVIKTDILHVRADHLSHGHMIWDRNSALQFCAGTASSSAHIEPLINLSDPSQSGDALTLPPGSSGVLRLKLDEPLPIWRGQRIIFRAFSAPHSSTHGLTVGGGEVLDPQPTPGRAQKARWIELAKVALQDNPEQELVTMVLQAGGQGISEDDAQLRMGAVDFAQLAQGDHVQKAGIVRLPSDGRLVDKTCIESIRQLMVDAVDDYHKRHSLQPGMGRAETLSKCPPRTASSVAEAALSLALEQGDLLVANDQGVLARPGKTKLDPNNLPPDMAKVMAPYVQAGWNAPTLKQVGEATGMDSKGLLEIISLLQKSELLVRITNEISLPKAKHDEFVGMVKSHLAGNETIDVQDIKTLTGLSRKYAVPMMEHCDRIGLTVRRGDARYPGPKAKD